MSVVLVVEDDPFICELTEMTVQDWGHQTFVAHDVDEALKILRSPQHIDLLFTDIYISRLRSQVVLTSHGRQSC
jgi:CheY-like chemotaxis protein